MIRGVGITQVMSIGKALPKGENDTIVIEAKIDSIEGELTRFEEAIAIYKERLKNTMALSQEYFGHAFEEYYIQHLRVLQDSIIVSGVRKQIQEQHVSAVFVLHEIKMKYAHIYERMNDDFLKKKADYIRHITEAIADILVEKHIMDTIELNEAILVAKNVEPMDLGRIAFEQLKGIIIEESDYVEFAKAISMRWNIPLIYGAKRATEIIQANDKLVMDTNQGEVLINPNKDVIETYNERIRRRDEFERLYEAYRHKGTKTRDNQHICISSLASNQEEVKEALEMGAEGIGLYRTEHLFVGREEEPSEAEHLEVYRRAVEASKGQPICFRTFDGSANNAINYIHIPEQINPFLGYRSTRIMLQHRRLLVTQLKAIMQAAQYGDVRFVVPMMSNVNDILDIRLMIEDACLQLEEEGKNFNRDIPFGIIIETPSAAIMTSVLAQEVDFIYVDTDDLLVLVTGMDPMNAMMDIDYNSFDPGFIRLLCFITHASHQEGTPVGFYGQVSSNELLVPLMLGIGMDELIVEDKGIGRVRFEINTTTKTYWDRVVQKVAQIKTGERVKHLLEKSYADQFLH